MESKVSEKQCALTAAFLAAAALWVSGLTGCGISTGDGFVMGSTGYLAEYNKSIGKEARATTKKEISDSDRAEMNAFLERNYGR